MALTTKKYAPTRPWRRTALLAATAVVAGGILAAIVLAPGDGGESALASATEETATSSLGSAASATSTTALPKGSLVPQSPYAAKSPTDADWLTAAPQQISWQRVDGVPLPFSGSDGPSRIDGAIAQGYTRTPQGAVIAAIQIGMRLIFSPDFESVVSRQTAVTDSERQQLITARSSSPSIDAVSVNASTLQPAAFKIGAYTDTDATIYFAYPAATGTYRIARMAVTWSGGDWKYTGRMAPDAPQLPDTGDVSTFTAL